MLEYKSLALVLLPGPNKYELVPQIYWAYVDAGDRELSFGKRDDRDRRRGSGPHTGELQLQMQTDLLGFAESQPKYI